MVGNLTVGKKRYAEVEDDVRAALERLDAMRAQLVALVDEDARAFEPLASAYRMPKSTPEEAAAKDRAMQEALIGACEAPLAIMRLCSTVIDECEFLAREGSRMAVSDAGVAVAFARAALLGASLNVYINVGSISDEGRSRAYRDRPTGSSPMASPGRMRFTLTWQGRWARRRRKDRAGLRSRWSGALGKQPVVALASERRRRASRCFAPRALIASLTRRNRFVDGLPPPSSWHG